MQLALGILLLLCFLVGVVAVMRGQSPIIVLMLLAIVWAATTGAPLREVLGKVIDGGATAYAGAVILIVFGAWFGQVLVQTGIAESLIRSAVELAGDRPLVVAWVVSLVTAFLFTSLYGVGAAIGVGVIALPIMMSMGIPPRVAAPAFTMAIGAGNYLNLVEFGIFQKFFPGIKYEGASLRFFMIGGAVYLAMALAMSAWHLARGGTRRFAAVAGPAEGTAAWTRVPRYAYLAPAVPLAAVALLRWPMIPAFLLGIVFALLVTGRSRSLKGSVDLFHKAFYDAFPDIATIAALWIICGMLIVAGQLPQVQQALQPIFRPVLPKTPLQAAVFFAGLAPLAIYRGPFAVVGTGAALLSIMLQSQFLAVPYLYAVWRGPLCLQGSQDPTNSWTLWTLGFTKVTHKDFLRTALPFGWLMVAINAFIAYVMLGR
ncbi:MAG: hypothetical protein DME09_00400 [Candidatus Rokuibacteriota bacterium]|nr:MAG: hypothetical protein DME09_00400 [Candidatus Rokubacteria bacterium]